MASSVSRTAGFEHNKNTRQFQQESTRASKYRRQHLAHRWNTTHQFCGCLSRVILEVVEAQLLPCNICHMTPIGCLCCLNTGIALNSTNCQAQEPATTTRAQHDATLPLQPLMCSMVQAAGLQQPRQAVPEAADSQQHHTTILFIFQTIFCNVHVHGVLLGASQASPAQQGACQGLLWPT